MNKRDFLKNIGKVAYAAPVIVGLGLLDTPAEARGTIRNSSSISIDRDNIHDIRDNINDRIDQFRENHGHGCKD